MMAFSGKCQSLTFMFPACQKNLMEIWKPMTRTLILFGWVWNKQSALGFDGVK